MSPIEAGQWPEIRSWGAFAVSLVAILIAVFSYRRGELHRRHALTETDLGRFEGYWHEMKQYLSSVNSHRADLCTPMRELQRSRSIDWTVHDLSKLEQPRLLWPLLPGDQTERCVEVFKACQYAWAATHTFEERLRRQADFDLVHDGLEAAGTAIEEADRVLKGLADAIVRERAGLRGRKARGLPK